MDAAIFGCRLVLLFFLYSFLGWCVESTYCSVLGGKLVNRGFLNGPLCPVYGFGAMAVVYLLTPVSGSLVLLYFSGLVLVSIIEYFTGWLLETIFHTKWWDYSDRRFNLKGRVCLMNALLFGVLGVFAMRGLQPFLERHLGRLSAVMTIWLASACTTLLAVDLVLSVRTALQLSGKLDAIREALEETKAKADAVIGESRLQAALFMGMTPAERAQTLSHSHTFMHRRLLDAFPSMKFSRSPASLESLRRDVAAYRLRKKKK